MTKARKKEHAGETPPGWAQELLRQFTEVKESFKQNSDELNDRLKNLKEESCVLIKRG